MDLFEEIVRMRQAGQRGAMATIVHTNGSIPSYESSRMLVREDGSIAGTIGGGCVEAEVWAAAKDVIRIEQPRKMTFNLNHEAAYDAGLICGGTLEIFVEPILPQPTLYIFGGGHVSTAVARAASAAGFAIGDRGRPRNVRERGTLPDGGEIYTTYEDAFEKIKPNASSYLLDRHARAQGRYARAGLGRANRGALHRNDRQQAQSDFRLQGARKRRYSPEKFERVHAPVGLDIGALTPEEIAVSITAELIAVRRNAKNLPHKSVKLSHAATPQQR